MAKPTFDGMTAEHFQDHIFGTDPIREFAGQFYSPDLWHREIKGMTGDCHGDIQASCADRQHTQRTGRGCVTIRAQQGFTGLAEILHMNRMADSIPRTAEPETKTFTGALQK